MPFEMYKGFRISHGFPKYDQPTWYWVYDSTTLYHDTMFGSLDDAKKFIDKVTYSKEFTKKLYDLINDKNEIQS